MIIRDDALGQLEHGRDPRRVALDTSHQNDLIAFSEFPGLNSHLAWNENCSVLNRNIHNI